MAYLISLLLPRKSVTPTTGTYVIAGVFGTVIS